MYIEIYKNQKSRVLEIDLHIPPSSQSTWYLNPNYYVCSGTCPAEHRTVKYVPKILAFRRSPGLCLTTIQSTRRPPLWGKAYVRAADHSAWPWYALEYSLLFGSLLDRDKYLGVDQSPWLAFIPTCRYRVLTIEHCSLLAMRYPSRQEQKLSSETSTNILQNSTSS